MKMPHKNVLVVAAHADDEALGCGGMMARHADEGANVTVFFMADGETARAGASKDSLEARQQAASEACGILGAQKVRFDNFPDNQLDTVALLDLCKSVEAIIAECEPQIIYTHHGGDMNIDHRRVHQAVLTACRPAPGHCVKKICSFEVLSSTEWASPAFGPAFNPNVFCDISDYLQTKLKALQSYHNEMRDFPHSRSYKAVEALARLRGASAGFEAAEAFISEREMI